MPKTKKLRIGTGAECSVITRFLHPSKDVKEKYTNVSTSHKVDNLFVQRREKKLVNRKEQWCVVFTHPDWDDKELHCCERYATVTKEGHESHFFRDEDKENTPPEVPPMMVIDEFGMLVVEEDDLRMMERCGNSNEDIVRVRGLGLNVDDDNEPAPENIPTENSSSNNSTTTNTTWGWTGFCLRRTQEVVNHLPRLRLFGERNLADLTFLMVFMMLFPKAWLENVLLKETNKNLDKELTYGELLRFIGLILKMSTTSGFDRRSFWSHPSNSCDDCPYKFHDLMSRNRFESIIQALSFTDIDPPSFLDKFWEVRQMIKEWNDNMKNNFIPSWISCLDESMSIWFGKFSCPGWIFCPRKPHPYGNEYHSICCGISGVMFAIELVEGKDRPRQLGPLEDNDKGGPTTGLLLRLTKGIAHCGKCIILDSGFCVLKALIELRKRGVYATSVIKKRRYWPAHVDGDAIDNHMKDKEVGATDVLNGKLDDTDYNIFCLKEADYTMKLMGTFGTNTPVPNAPKARRFYTDPVTKQDVRTEFDYTEPFANHFAYRHVVDDHNNLRHQCPSLEETWKTTRWPIRVFTFLLAITEINTFLIFRHFLWKDKNDAMTLLQFRRRLAEMFIHNEYLVGAPCKHVLLRKRKRDDLHKICSAPYFAKKFDGNKWILGAKQMYQQLTCSTPGCQIKTRNYCSCSPHQWRCKSCMINHVFDQGRCDSSGSSLTNSSDDGTY